jgi:hypothetical protein
MFQRIEDRAWALRRGSAIEIDERMSVHGIPEQRELCTYVV